MDSYDSIVDLERNNGIPDLLSTAAVLAAALGAAYLAVVATRARWQATALAILLSIVALDDVFQQEPGARDVPGVLVTLTIVSTGILVVVVARHGSRRPRVTLLVGLSLLVICVKGAYGYDQFLNLFGRGDQERGDLDYEIGVVLKQGLEFVGWSFVALGLWMSRRSRTQTGLATSPTATSTSGSSSGGVDAHPAPPT
jgi:hypothetical protein